MGSKLLVEPTGGSLSLADEVPGGQFRLRGQGYCRVTRQGVERKLTNACCAACCRQRIVVV